MIRDLRMLSWRAESGSAGGSSDLGEPEPSGDRLATQIAVGAGAFFVCTMIWGLTGRDYFWPCWVLFGFASWIGAEIIFARARAVEPGPERSLALHRELSVHLGVMMVAIWVFSGFGYFWPVWTIIGLAALLGVHQSLVNRGEQPARMRELADRIDTLTRTRRGAVDVQADELRRIERDLHDGAQARLVALSMQLGRAEARLEDHPEAAELVRNAKGEAGAAIAELRDLARGIAPPVLTDRGLAAAIEALAQRSSIEVATDVDVPERPPRVIENAAYFVVAEALTNVAKHGGGAPAAVVVLKQGETLSVRVRDEGPGGADSSAGSGLDGMRRRVEALDGSLEIESPADGGTTITVELPCGQ